MAPAAPRSKLCRVVGTKWELPSILLLTKSWPDRQRPRLKNANYSNTQDLTSAGPFFLERTFVQTHRIFVSFALETGMQIHLERSGGFAGLRLIHDIDSRALSEEQHAELKKLIGLYPLFVHTPVLRVEHEVAGTFLYYIDGNVS